MWTNHFGTRQVFWSVLDSVNPHSGTLSLWSLCRSWPKLWWNTSPLLWDVEYLSSRPYPQVPYKMVSEVGLPASAIQWCGPEEPEMKTWSAWCDGADQSRWNLIIGRAPSGMVNFKVASRPEDFYCKPVQLRTTQREVIIKTHDVNIPGEAIEKLTIQITLAYEKLFFIRSWKVNFPDRTVSEASKH